MSFKTGSDKPCSCGQRMIQVWEAVVDDAGIRHTYKGCRPKAAWEAEPVDPSEFIYTETDLTAERTYTLQLDPEKKIN
jgi:hypothetical protein